jgi:dipeptidyl aminopeptidase/acylaminoacyl peptidase
MSDRFKPHLVRLALLVLVAPASLSAQPRPFTVHDLVAIERVSGPAASPDGSRVAFTLSTLDAAANRRRTDVWVVGTDGSGLRQLTTDPASDTSAAWSPDGRTLFFLSSRSGSSQVWRVAVDGGEPQAVTSLPLDVGGFVRSPDGTHLAVSLDVFVDCDTLECTATRLEANAKRQASGQIYDRLFVRHWDTWKDGRRSHVFVVPVAGGPAVDVMRGMDADCPSKPFGGADEFAFTPDGKAIVFTTRDAGREEAWSTDFNLYLAPVDGGTAPRNLTAGNPAWDTSPVFSPDGRTLAYRAMTRAGYESDRFRIILRAWPDGPERVLADAWDRSPNEIVWSADGRTIYATAANLGQESLFAIDVASGAVRTVVKEGHVAGPGIAGGHLVAAIDHLTSPAELHVVKPDGSGLRAITRVNADRLAAVAFGTPEQFTFPGWNDETVHAWIVKPVDFDPARRYPVAFLIHGGPQGSFSNNFHYRWNAQTYAAAGYAAVMVDFHGSVGYGQAFTDSIRGDWGGKPLVDLQKGLDAALAKYPWMDGGRACALGASYGGFMINWIAGNWPDRFRCLVNHDGNLDERFAYYATEELWFPEWEHGGAPWEHPESYATHNPIDHVSRWKTPMLVIHGGRDYRVVYSEGLATFTALQRRGIPSRFLYFPDENHWVLRPANSVLWHETVLAWLDRWTRAGGGTAGQ